MTAAVKSCGGCQGFIKRKSDDMGGGLCTTLDARTTSDGGRNCLHHRPIPYSRDKYRAEFHRLAREYLRAGVEVA